MARQGGTSRARSGSRDLLVQALYQWQIGGASEEELLEQFAEVPSFVSIDQVHFRRVLAAALRDHEDIEKIIGGFAERTTLALDPISRAVLLIALTELKGFEDIPTKVVINEAIELTKRYGAAESYRFVNAVVDKASKNLRATPQEPAG